MLLTNLLTGVFLFDSSSDAANAAPLILCLSGFIFFAVVYLRYRNVDKRHMHEKETLATTEKLQSYDQLAEHRTRLRSRHMHGANNDRIEGAQNTSDALAEGAKQLKSLIGK
jgi:hypothetical protein